MLFSVLFVICGRSSSSRWFNRSDWWSISYGPYDMGHMLKNCFTKTETIMDSIRMSHNPYDDFVSVFDMVSIFIRDFRCHFMNVITGSIFVQLLKRSNISFFFQFSVLKSCKEFSTENNFWLTAVSLYWVHGCPRQHFDPLQTKWIKIQTQN